MTNPFTFLIRRTALWLAMGLLALWPAIAPAQSAPPLSLLADSIYLNQTTGDLVATGNVQVFYQGRVLSAQEIRYNSVTKTIKAEGPLQITDADGTIVTAAYAELSSDLKEALIRSARFLLAEQLQLAATEARRSAGRFNTLTNVVASSCQVCASRPTPVWQIRAEQVIHDEEKQRIYFRKARFEVLGLPILYLPYLRIPSPEVKRATGFLRPIFLSSTSLGDGIKLPYYATFGTSADMTITPTLTLQGAFLLDTEVRKRFANGGFDVFGAVALRDSTGILNRGYLTTNGKFTLSNDVVLSFDATAVTDNGFMRQFGYDETDRLVSEVRAQRYRERSYFSIVGAVLNSLRDDENNATIPLVLPEISYRSYGTDPVFGGKLGYEFNAVGLSRQIGQDVARVGGSVDYTIPLEFSDGIQATGFARADLDLYRVWNGPYPNRVLLNLHPTIGAELRWPLEKTTERAQHIFVPVVQLMYTADPAFNDVVPNEDSILAEFDETNLFALSRYPGRDASEIGFRANIGASYSIYAKDGWQLGLAGGVVLRSNPSTQFTQDILGALRIEYPGRLRFTNRFLFDENLNIKRLESDLTLHRDNWDISGAFVHLGPDPLAGSPVARTEASLDGKYRFADNWEFSAGWTRDFISGSDVTASTGLTYGNECIEVGLSLTRRFTSSISVPSATDVNLVIELAGFGGISQNTWPASRCAY